MPVLLEISFGLERRPEVLYPVDVHGMIFNLFEESVARRVHQLNKKPFSLRRFSIDSKSLKVEIGLLDEGLYSALLHGYYFPRNQFNIRGIPIKTLKDKGIKEKKLKSYEEIASGTPYRRIGMEFLSPVAFNRYGLDYPIPEPSLLFSNLLHRWKSFSDVPLEIEEEEILKGLAVQKIEGQTQEFSIDQRLRRIGFLGRVSFLVKREELAQRVSALSVFSTFSGVGMKTPMGMGAVKVFLKQPIQR